jgi:predicted small integral membrane protein
MRWAMYVACIGEMRNVYNILVGKPEEKILLESHRHRRGDNMEIDLKETRYEGVHWIHLAQDKDHWWTPVNSVVTFRFQRMQETF